MTTIPSTLTEIDITSALDISVIATDFAFCDQQTAYTTELVCIAFDANVFSTITER